MPHPARSLPGSHHRPCFDSERGNAADRGRGHQAQDRTAACRVCSRIRVFPSKAAGARRKRRDVRFADEQGFRGGAIRVVRGRRVVPSRPLPPASLIHPRQGRQARPLETVFRRYLVAGG